MAKSRKKRGHRSQNYRYTLSTRFPLRTPKYSDLLSKLTPVKIDLPKPSLPSINPLKKLRSPIIIKRRKIKNDRRFYRPEKSPIETYGPRDQYVRLTLATRSSTGTRRQSTRLQYTAPQMVEVCKRRSICREVLFRLGKAGKGRGIKTPKKLTERSKISC